MSILLEYENQLFEDIFHNDALLIMAKGLGIERIFTNFIKFSYNYSYVGILSRIYYEQYFG